MPALGTLRWVERTGGKLVWHNKLRMIADGVRARAATKARMQQGIKVRYTEIDDILPPDSPIATEAVAISEADSARFLHLHNLRAYFWARLLYEGRRKFDDEAVFVAIMLHDLGLTDAHRPRDDNEHCFTIIGAHAAQTLAARHQWNDRRAAIAANAITLHLNVSVAERHGPEAQMVRAGSGADVAGLGLDVLHQDQIDAVVQRYPRHDFKRAIAVPLAHEAAQHPCCRIAFMHQRLGFGHLIQHAPMFCE
jgi:hypothetical protein